MRLDDWQKWLDEQFFDTNPTKQPEPGGDEVLPPGTDDLAPGGPPNAPPLALRAEPLRDRPAPAVPLAPDDDGEIPSIEQYLPFLNRRQAEEPAAPEASIAAPQPEPEASDQETDGSATLASLAEPSDLAPELPADVQASEVHAPDEKEAPEDVRNVAPASPRRAAARRTASSTADAKPMTTEDFWRLTPRHIHKLVALGEDEVTQRSYKRQFKESRLALIERLLDPTLSLEDAARLLGVCPTTVRRYSNRGLLRHQRTAGDQRRFKLSDVLAFLEDPPPTDRPGRPRQGAGS